MSENLNSLQSPYTFSNVGLRSQEVPADAVGSVVKFFSAFDQQLREAEQVAKSTLMGDRAPHDFVEKIAHAQLTLETAVTIREKAVEAYQEILRMPV